MDRQLSGYQRMPTSMVLLFVISQAKSTSLAIVPSRGIFAILADKQLQFTSQDKPLEEYLGVPGGSY